MNNITLELVDICDPFSVFDRMRSFFVETNQNPSLMLLYQLRKENHSYPVTMVYLKESLLDLKEMGRITFTNNRLFSLETIDRPMHVTFCGLRQYLTKNQIQTKRKRAATIQGLDDSSRAMYEWILAFLLCNGYYPTHLEARKRNIVPSKQYAKTVTKLVENELIDEFPFQQNNHDERRSRR